MYRILIWGCGLQYGRYINAIKYQEILGNIEVAGVTGKDRLYKYLDGYRFIPLEELDNENIDYVVAASEEHYKEICTMAVKMGFDSNRIMQGKVFCLPYFNFARYVDLMQSNISIIANNCWGGVAYHALGMQFYSPFINMFLNDADYIRMLSNLSYYLNQQLQFERMGYTPVLKRNYPVCRLDDVELHFNHYTSMEDVSEKWIKRLKYLNWNNLFIMMFTEDYCSLKDFDRLPFGKKVCFVPFESPLESAFNLQVAAYSEMQKVPFWEIVNKTASGYYHDYDLIQLLISGKVNYDRYNID